MKPETGSCINVGFESHVQLYVYTEWNVEIIQFVYQGETNAGWTQIARAFCMNEGFVVDNGILSCHF